jgi:hypothetical protein
MTTTVNDPTTTATNTTGDTSRTAMDAFVDCYMAMWNEPDARRRRAVIEELWAPDAANYTVSMEAVGHDAIEARVTRSYNLFVGTGAHTFRPAQPYAVHHGAMRVWWEMVALADGSIAATGHEFLVLDGAGRIVSDHQFPVSV